MHADCNGQAIKLRVHIRSADYDYALLNFDGIHTHLEINNEHPETLISRRVALCAFQIGIAEHLPEFHTSSMGVMPASIVKVSRQQHHLVLQSDTWPGDSGGAVVLHDGCLVGIHLEGVNSLREKFEQQKVDQRLTEAEESLASAAQSVAMGCICLHVKTFSAESL